MSLTTPFSVQKLQTALHAKAKESPNCRFHALYDKVYRKDVLAYAYERCPANGGAAGVDNQTFENIEAYDRERWLEELTQELKSRTYQPQPVRRVYIPKPDGKQRPLGIPTIRDRVVQTSAMLVLEPIFEADLQPEQYAYRADRSALDAVQHVHKLINTGHGQIALACAEAFCTGTGKLPSPSQKMKVTWCFDGRICPICKGCMAKSSRYPAALCESCQSSVVDVEWRSVGVVQRRLFWRLEIRTRALTLDRQMLRSCLCMPTELSAELGEHTEGMQKFSVNGDKDPRIGGAYLSPGVASARH